MAMTTTRQAGVTSPDSGAARRTAWGELPWLLALALVTLLGGVLRRYHLGQQGLWFDEADLVMRARQPIPDLLLLFARPGENGPLYSLGLNLWMRVAGTAEAAVRLPSAIFGTLAIPALYGLGRELRGPRVGLLAACLLALSPYAHWYAQDAKMYSLAVLVVIAATWLLLIALRRGGRWWITYALIAVAGVFVHAAVALVLVAHAGIVAVLWRAGVGTRPGGRQRRWLTALAVLAAVPLALWGVAFLVRLGPTWQPEAAPWTIIGITLNEFGATHRADATTQAVALWLYLALAALGVFLTLRLARAVAETVTPPVAWRERVRGRRAAVMPGAAPLAGCWSARHVLLIVGCLAAVPVLLFALMSLRRAIFADRYLIVALPGYLLLVALGFDGLWRVGRGGIAAAAKGTAVVAAIGVLWLASVPLATVNLSAQSQKEDWREAYRHIAERARPGDGVVVAPGYLRTTFDYYALQFPALRDLRVVSALSLAPELDVTDRAVTAFFQTETRGWERVWLLRSDTRTPRDDPDGRLPAFLKRESTTFESRHWNGVLLDCQVYGKPYQSTGFIPQAVADVRFGETGIVLHGASWQTGDGTNRVARDTFAPLLLQWIAPDTRPPADYTVLVRLTDAGGKEVARYDISPLDGNWPTSTWRDGDDPYDPHDLKIPANLPPGDYRVHVGLAPLSAPTQPLPAYARDGTRAEAPDGLLPLLTVTVT